MNDHRSSHSSLSTITGLLRHMAPGMAALFLFAAGCLVDQTHKTKVPSARLGLQQAQVAVVGTIHKMHLVTRDYPMQVLDALIEEWNPDLVLVAIPPEALAAGAWEQSPIEFPYVVWSARHARIPVEGIGWHSPEGCKAKAAAMQAKMRDMMAKMKKAKASGKTPDIKTMMADKMASMLPKDAVGPARHLMQLMPPSFETAHSLAFERLQRVLFNAMARTKPKMFLRAMVKEANMAHLAAQAIRRHHAKRVLLVVGLRHRTALSDHLAGLGAKLVDPTTIVASRGLQARSFLNRPISQQVIAMWRKAVDHIQARLDRTAGPMRMMLAMKRYCLKLAIAQNGRCCLAPDKLFAPMKELSSMFTSEGSVSRPSPTATGSLGSAVPAHNAARTETARGKSDNESSTTEGDQNSAARPPDASSEPRPASRPQAPARPDEARDVPAVDGHKPHTN